jgi:oligoribonuclease
MDMEMTGLDERRDHILEVAAMVTDWEFNVLEEYQHVVFQPPEILQLMDEWCQKTHGESGLTALVPKGKPLREVEKDLVAMIGRFWKGPYKRKDDKPILAGNSIWNDRRFIDFHMKEFSDHLHYRMVDVSAFKEVFRSKYNVMFKKKNGHRAVDDILESIEELKAYLQMIDPSKAPVTTGGPKGM